MKFKNLIVRVVVALFVVAGFYAIFLNLDINQNIFLYLLLFAGFIIIDLLTFKYNFKNIGFGILFGLIISVSLLIAYLLFLLFSKLQG